MEIKVCGDCKTEVPIDKFPISARYWRKKTKDWGETRSKYCNKCLAQHQKEWRESDPERLEKWQAHQKEYHKTYHRNKYKKKDTMPERRIIVRDEHGVLWNVVKIKTQMVGEERQLVFTVNNYSK